MKTDTHTHINLKYQRCLRQVALVVDGIFHDMDLLLRSLQVNSDMPLADVWLHPDGLLFNVRIQCWL